MPVLLTYSSSPNCIIGCKGKLPWNAFEVLELFKKLTLSHAVIMGHGTWHSLGNTGIPDRTNVVLSNRGHVRGSPDIILSNLTKLADLISKDPGKKYFIIGGAFLFQQILQSSIKVDEMYVSRVLKIYKGDAVFYNSNWRFILKKQQSYGEFDFLHYKYAEVTECNETPYLNLLKKILEQGYEQDDRTGTGTLAVFGAHLEFNLKQSFPLLTTKKMAWKSIQEELFFFLAGKTNTQELEAKGVKIWQGNTSKEFISRTGLNYPEGEMGPMYGYQWRNFGGTRLDQLEKIITELKSNPTSRRIVMTTFNPIDVDKGVLWPCHGIVLQFFCRLGNDKKYQLSALMYQRSADVFLGLPFNIASYSLLVHLVANRVGMIPDRLIISIGNAHLYKTHINQANIQLSRAPLIQPQLEITKPVESFDALNQSYIKLWGYFYHSQIVAEMAV